LNSHPAREAGAGSAATDLPDTASGIRNGGAAARAAVLLELSPFAFILVIAAGYFFIGLDSYGLLNNNEGLYATIAREMREHASFVVPHLNGIPFLEKPPLLYWLTDVSYAVFGESGFASRIAPASAGVMTCLAIALFCIWAGAARAGLLASVILSSSIGYVLITRTLIFDGLCHFSCLKDFAGVRSNFSVWFPLLGGTTWVRSFFVTAPVT
jgi:hypothetical protein